jgi:hypothetical protein
LWGDSSAVPPNPPADLRHPKISGEKAKETEKIKEKRERKRETEKPRNPEILGNPTQGKRKRELYTTNSRKENK